MDTITSKLESNHGLHATLVGGLVWYVTSSRVGGLGSAAVTYGLMKRYGHPNFGTADKGQSKPTAPSWNIGPPFGAVM